MRQSSIAARIAYHERVLRALKAQQHAELVALVVGTGELFNAAGLWSQPDVRAPFVEAGVTSPRQLGRWLQHAGFDRVCRDGDGIVWSGVSQNVLHDDAGIPIIGDV